MARYAVRSPRGDIRGSSPRGYIQHTEDAAVFMPYLAVPGPREVNTGLVDELGQEIWRLPDPIGFHFE